MPVMRYTERGAVALERLSALHFRLGLGALWLEAFLGFEATALSGFGLFFGISFGYGHGKLLRTVEVSDWVRRKPCPVSVHRGGDSIRN